MFDGNMVTLVEYHKFHLLLVKQKLDCDQMFYKRSQTMDGTFHWYVEERVTTSHFCNLFPCT